MSKLMKKIAIIMIAILTAVPAIDVIAKSTSNNTVLAAKKHKKRHHKKRRTRRRVAKKRRNKKRRVRRSNSTRKVKSISTGPINTDPTPNEKVHWQNNADEEDPWNDPAYIAKLREEYKNVKSISFDPIK